jgi:hypothetical protein
VRVAITACAAIMTIAMAGCATSTPSRTSHPSNAPGTQIAASHPATSTPLYSGPELPGGQCPFLSTAQVQTAFGQPVQHVIGCNYRFAHSTGSMGVLTTTYTTPAQAQSCLTLADHGLKVTKLPEFGPLAQVTTGPLDDTTALAIRGARRLTVGIIWPTASAHPDVAVALLRDVMKNFNQYSASPALGCS